MTTTGDGWPRCSYVAQAAGDPREGTAPPVDHWFLVEHPGPWGRIPLTQSALDRPAVAALAEWAHENGGRVVLVRRPGRAVAAAAEPRRWFRVDSRPGRESTRTGTFTDDRELAAALYTPGEPHEDPLYLVCAHGRHDTCCAVRGRPLAAALATGRPTRVWECSHIGGCRFAPVLVLLPHGFTFGGVPVDEVTTLVDDYEAGVLDPRRLRGRTSVPPFAQAAQHHARRITGALGVDALRAVSATLVATGRWRVTLADPDCVAEVAEHHVETGRPLTCAATTLGWARVFELLRFDGPSAGAPR
jgi:hypothetical protein